MSGIGAILFGAAHLAQGIINQTPIDWTLVGTSITTGIGLLFARDNNKTSEEVGAKHK